MKIIRKGNATPEPVRFECRKCHCVFEAVRDLEAKRVSDQRDGDYYTCQCPQCDTDCTRQA